MACLIILLFCTIPGTNAFAVFPKAAQNRESYSSGSWALGIVVPENVKFPDGGLLSWHNATSVTAIVRLPNISYTDAPTLAVVSLMAENGFILQVAAGIYPGMANWRAYAWFIRGFPSASQTYEWVLNSSKPEMVPYTWVSLSVFLLSGRWRYRVDDLSNHEDVEGEFSSDAAPSIKVGDQEIFAFESYSVSISVFEHMGDLILSSIIVDGRNVSGGWYSYGTWDPSRNPLFVVGGDEPPPFISLQVPDNAMLSWSYEEWTVPEPTLSFDPTLLALIVIPFAVVAVCIAVWKVRKKTR